MGERAELEKRLRDLHADCRRWVYESGLGDGHEPSRLLRASRDALNEAADAVAFLQEALASDSAKTREINLLTRENREQAAALTPFAALAAHITGRDDACWCGQGPAIIRHADIRRAAAVLGGAQWAGSDTDATLIAEASDRAIAITTKDRASADLLQRLAGALSAHGNEAQAQFQRQTNVEKR